MLKAPRLHFGIDDPDAPDVSPLIRELDGYLAELYPTGNIRPVTAQELKQANVTFLTARVDGTPVACGAIVRHGDYAEVKRMYVLPACRGLDLGKQLLDALETEIARTGGKVVRLETGTAQAEALELYGHAGYRRCPPFGEHRANPRSICMEKALA
ncbi:putative acetyltransferase [Dyella jiangningensis]|uniref:GNAT family N-acetyltransferase n=1 Tax=Dyella sp. AtDHG13 TaxID=1938897 RepID=UPI00088621C0|nr:GNAT family N-acetyltransferase [Dyella sp. AtDHG13]PXV56134.1 putative acetyltransferase [Dyella sp. AtDHG13]SDK73058.1 putative acetyltransferase [Dyella jiangningensis]